MADTTVLLVEHDDMILAFVRSVLRLHGYRVLAAHSGAEGMRIADRFGLRQIDLLLADIDMPTPGGAGLARRCRQLRPELRLLCMTERPGRLADELGEDGCKAIEKPFAYTTLLRSVEACLFEEKPLRAAS